MASNDKTATLWGLQPSKIKTFQERFKPILNQVLGFKNKYLATTSGNDNDQTWKWQELVTFEGHSDGIESIVFSPNGEYIATASSDKTAKLWNLQGRELVTFQGHSNSVTSVSFSPDGKYLATASNDRTAKLWDLQGRQLVTFTGHYDSVTSVSFSPDNEYLATASNDGTAKLWDLQGRQLVTFTGHSAHVLNVCFSPHGEYLATAALDHTIKVWDLQGSLLADFRGYKGNLLEGKPDFIELLSCVLGVCFTPDSKNIVSIDMDGTVRFWQFESLEELIERGKAWLGVD